jgi:uncharacterized protein
MTGIGAGLRAYPMRLALMMAIGVAVVSADFLNSYDWHATCDEITNLAAVSLCKSNACAAGTGSYQEALDAYDEYVRAHQSSEATYWLAEIRRVALVLFVLASYWLLAKRRFSAIGLSLAPSQGWWYWCRAAVLLAILSALLTIPVGLCLLCLGWRIESILEQNWEDDIVVNFFVNAPLLEESIYRIGVCVPIAALVGPRTAIVASGILFAILHFIYGNANPVNMIAGFLLAWSFMKSNTILVPVLLHLFGNILAIALLKGWLLPFLRG